MRLGDRSRCLRCGGRIVLVKNPRVISLNSGVWMHSGGLRQLVSNHHAVGPGS